MLTIGERLAIAGLGALAVGVRGLQIASRLVTRLLRPDATEDAELDLPCSQERGLRRRPRYRSICEEPLEPWRG